MTREVFDTLILVVILIGMAFAVVRLNKDFTRPLPKNKEPEWYTDEATDEAHLEDTQPNRTEID